MLEVRLASATGTDAAEVRGNGEVSVRLYWRATSQGKLDRPGDQKQVLAFWKRALKGPVPSIVEGKAMIGLARTLGMITLIAAATVGVSACGTSSASDQSQARIAAAEAAAQRAEQAATSAQQSAARAEAAAERTERIFQQGQRK